jgi:hypothetical protein
MASVTIGTGSRRFQYIQYANNYGDTIIPSGVRPDTNTSWGGGGGGGKTITFGSSDISGGLITFNHKLNTYPVFEIYDNTSKVIIPDSATYIDRQNLQVDLHSYTVTGTWTIKLA